MMEFTASLLLSPPTSFSPRTGGPQVSGLVFKSEPRYRNIYICIFLSFSFMKR